MRSPDRIPEVLEAVRHYWRQYPDLRFMQLVAYLQARIDLTLGKDAYYLEDAELVAKMGDLFSGCEHHQPGV